MSEAVSQEKKHAKASSPAPATIDVMGLTTDEAQLRYASFGPNLINTEKKRHLLWQFFSRFRNPLVILLLVASVISAFTADISSFFIIVSMVLLSVSLDFIQEYRAQSSADNLRQSVAVMATVLRDGQPKTLPIAKLVPGDVVLLSAGDLIPADACVVIADDFFVNQALLTGEPFPVEKFPALAANAAPDRPIPTLTQAFTDTQQAKRSLPTGLAVSAASHDDDANMVFAGSHVVSGSAHILISVTGAKTMLGQLASAISTPDTVTAFEHSTSLFGMMILRLTFSLILFVLLVSMWQHRPWLESFMFALALAVGLTPELLPMVITVTLSRGAMRMSQKKVIVKRLSAIHDLGSMDILCTDKTGTLTEAEISLARHLDCAGNDSEQVLQWAYLNSFFESGLKSPLDNAILRHQTIDTSQWQKIDEVPFDFERRRVSVLLSHQTQHVLVVKGAPEDVLSLCRDYESSPGVTQRMDTSVSVRFNAQAEALGQQGFRVLGIAWRHEAASRRHAVVSDESNLVFAGFAAFFDPPKVSAAHALGLLQKSGVVIKVVTGDNELVTQHLCAALGLAVSGVLTGHEIAQMDDAALQSCVDHVTLFCRVTPALKSRVLLALKQRGHVVGYLGDGMNDAPSLRIADVGISVDSATDVAKDAADLILLERDLNVLHQGVMEGRRTFGNIMKYVMMGTSSNFGNMFSMAGASVFLPFLPMLPIQILLNNLLYDLSEIAIPFDNVDEEFLQKPQHWNMRFTRDFMLVIGSVSSLFDFITFYVMLVVLSANQAMFRTGWFVESMATQVLVIFVIRTRRPLFKSQPNRWLVGIALSMVALAVSMPYSRIGAYFGFVPLPPHFFSILVGMCLLYLMMVAWVKRQFYHRYARKGNTL